MAIFPSASDLLKQIMVTVDVAWRNELDYSTINNWLSNFTGEALGDKDKEQNLALWLLYNFTYYNDEEIKHLCKLCLKKYIHETITEISPSIDEIKKILKHSRFLPLGKSSESGAYLLYLFRQQNDLPVSFFESDNMIDPDDNVVVIDDMTLSGEQALTGIRRIKYAGYELRREEISGEFITKMQEEHNSGLSKYIWEQIFDTGDGEFDKSIVAELITERIVKNKELCFENKELLASIEMSEELKKLVDKYLTDRSALKKIEIYKMNRLLLEICYDGMISHSIDNLKLKNWYLLTFIASTKAKEKLLKEGVRVISCIELDESSKAFSDESVTFESYPKEKELCEKMCMYYGKRIWKSEPLGYSNGQYLFGLSYTIPNNTLPIFWKTKDWIPLFVRHEKNYGGDVKDVFGKYV